MLADWRRDQAVRATAWLWAQHGYAGLRTADVALEMDVSPGTLFRYFDSKAALARAVLEDTHTALRHALVGAAGTRTRPEDGVRRTGPERLAALWNALVAFGRKAPGALACLELHAHPPRPDGRPFPGLLEVVEEALGVLEEARVLWLPAADAAPLLWGAFLAVFRRTARGEAVEAWAYGNAHFYVAESILPPTRPHRAPTSPVGERDVDVDPEEGEALPPDTFPSAQEVAAADAAAARRTASAVGPRGPDASSGAGTMHTHVSELPDPAHENAQPQASVAAEPPAREEASTSASMEAETSAHEEAATSVSTEAETSASEDAETSASEEAETSAHEEAATSVSTEAETSASEEAETPLRGKAETSVRENAEPAAHEVGAQAVLSTTPSASAPVVHTDAALEVTRAASPEASTELDIAPSGDVPPAPRVGPEVTRVDHGDGQEEALHPDPEVPWPRDAAGAPLGRRWRAVQAAFVSEASWRFDRPLTRDERSLLTTQAALRVVASVCDAYGLAPSVTTRDVYEVFDLLRERWLARN